MNGAQDLGGRMGFGPVLPEPSEPVFHAAWEGRVLANVIATQALRDALRVGLGPGGQILAHKHLAFAYCVTNREKQCRSEFRSALSIDPNFELEPAEAGHPLWGPIYREVKAQRK